MLPFQTLLVIDRTGATPVYQQIANGLIHIIRNGMIKPGSVLPSTRAMAVLLQVHRKTVVAAYEELSAQDWIESAPRKSISVSKRLPDLKPRSFKRVDETTAYKKTTGNFFLKLAEPTVSIVKKPVYRLVINDGFPDPRIAPVDGLLKQYRFLLKRIQPEGLIMHGDAEGSLHLRNAIAGFLGDTRAIHAEHENILLTRGAQMAIFIAARMIIKPGSTVIVGEPNYSNANMIFEHFGAKLVKVPVDEHGINADAIEKICRKSKPALLYVIPHHHHPTTVTLSAERRMKLLDTIRTFKLPVIEDDYDYDFHYNKSPILPLASADHNGYVLYIGSITKSFASTIRIGYLVAGAAFVQQAAALKEMIDIRGDVLMEEAMAVLFKSGDMQKHLKKSIKIYQARRDMFCSLLKDELEDMIRFTIPAGGMAVWARFEKKYPVQWVSERAAKLGLYMSPGHFYNTGKHNYNAARMGFAAMNKKEMEDIIQVMKMIRSGRVHG